jgi:GH18 family chitinase
VGPQGATGPAGPTGPQGPEGISAIQAFESAVPYISGSNLTLNLANGRSNFAFQQTSNLTVQTPINAASGTWGTILVQQDFGTAYTLAWSDKWWWPGGKAWTGSTSLGSSSLVEFIVVSGNLIIIIDVTENIQTSAAPPPPPGTVVYGLNVVPDAATDGDSINAVFTATNAASGTQFYWRIEGTGVTANMFNPASLTGVISVGNTGVAILSIAAANPLPANTRAQYSIKFYSDAARTQQVGNTAGGFLNSGVTKVKPKLGAYIDLYQYRNCGGVWPEGTYAGLNPNMRASNINTVLPQLDQFYMFSETQLFSDGKLYFGTNTGINAALVLNDAVTDWKQNTGNIFGGYVDASNPNYTYSAYALKNSMYYLKQQSAWASNNTVMCVGGYMLSQYMDLAGANDTLANTAGQQLAVLMDINGCIAVDLDYEPVGQVCVPANMARLCQRAKAALIARKPGAELHLTLIPSLSEADPDKKIATAVACAPFVDQINIMTYDDPNDLYEQNYQPGNVTVYNHTGVARSLQSVQWFINAGVPRNKLGVGFALYGRNSASAGAAFQNTGSPYDQIVRSADAAGQSGNVFPAGTYSGASPVQNTQPTSQNDYYANPVNCIWGFDSVGTIQEKVQSAYNMGLRAVFCWQISNDYANPGSAVVAGNARANFALIRAAKKAITDLV